MQAQWFIWRAVAPPQQGLGTSSQRMNLQVQCPCVCCHRRCTTRAERGQTNEDRAYCRAAAGV